MCWEDDDDDDDEEEGDEVMRDRIRSVSQGMDDGAERGQQHSITRAEEARKARRSSSIEGEDEREGEEEAEEEGAGM